MDSIIEVKELTRCFGDETAVDNVSFSVNRGEVFAFLGPNGAGKTTTVRMLTGIIEPTEGTASIKGHDIRENSLLSREHIAVVPEEANVYLDLSVWRNLMLMAELYNIPRGKRTKHGDELLEILDLSDRKEQKARALSKGLRQRLMLASALITDPEILFLDEPTGGLDVQSSRLIHEIIAERKKNDLTVFLTTHDMREAEQISDRVGIINNGEIIAINTPDGLRKTMKRNNQLIVKFKKDDKPDPGKLKEFRNVEKVRYEEDGRFKLYTPAPGKIATEVVRFADREKYSIEEIETQKATLEDIFIHLTSKNTEKDNQ